MHLAYCGQFSGYALDYQCNMYYNNMLTDAFIARSRQPMGPAPTCDCGNTRPVGSQTVASATPPPPCFSLHRG